MSNIPICIPTYKNRCPDNFNNLENLDTQFEVIIFTSGEDYYESGYDKIQISRPVTWVNTNTKSLPEKLEYIRNYVIDKGYEKAFIMEDDIKFDEVSKITPETKRTTSDTYAKIKVPMMELLNKMITLSEEYNAVLVCVQPDGNLGFSKPNSIGINKGLNASTLVLYDYVKVNSADVHYDISMHLDWTLDFIVQLELKGYDFVSIGDYGYINQKLSSNTTLGDDHVFFTHINMYIKYRDLGSLYISNGKSKRVSYRLLHSKLKNAKIKIIDDEYHNTLYELCKTQDQEKVKKYIMDHKQ